MSFLPGDSRHSTIKTSVGSDVQLPCHFPSSISPSVNALWFKETGDGQRNELSFEDDSGHDEKLTLLYPEDSDQTISVKRANSRDSGVYSCESIHGERLHTIHLIVEGILYCVSSRKRLAESKNLPSKGVIFTKYLTVKTTDQDDHKYTVDFEEVTYG